MGSPHHELGGHNGVASVAAAASDGAPAPALAVAPRRECRAASRVCLTVASAAYGARLGCLGDATGSVHGRRGGEVVRVVAAAAAVQSDGCRRPGRPRVFLGRQPVRLRCFLCWPAWPDRRAWLWRPQSDHNWESDHKYQPAKPQAGHAGVEGAQPAPRTGCCTSSGVGDTREVLKRAANLVNEESLFRVTRLHAVTVTLISRQAMA